jgi:hypothetical protein
VAVIRVEHIFCSNETFDNLGLWVIPVKIQGEKRQITVNFLLDTGAQKTILSPDIQAIVGITETNDSTRGVGIGRGSPSYRVGKAENLEIGSIALGEFEILIGNLPGIFAKYKIDGLLGSDIFNGKGLCLKLDYPQKYLKIEKEIVSL